MGHNQRWFIVTKMQTIGLTVGAALLVYLFLIGLISLITAKPNLGMVGGCLKPCPNKPNCVCSDFEDTTSFIEPIPVQGTPEEAWDRAKQAVLKIGGVIETETGDYLRAVFKTRLFRFVDDVELRLDKEKNVIHLRSASRLGYSDFGVNRKRVETLRSVLERG